MLYLSRTEAYITSFRDICPSQFPMFYRNSNLYSNLCIHSYRLQPPISHLIPVININVQYHISAKSPGNNLPFPIPVTISHSSYHTSVENASVPISHFISQKDHINANLPFPISYLYRECISNNLLFPIYYQ